MSNKKFNFKADMEKTKKFLLRFKDVKEPIVTTRWSSFFKEYIDVIYIVGLVILGICALAALFKFPDLSATFFGLVAVFVAFIVFRMLCEILSGAKIGEKTTPKKISAAPTEAKIVVPPKAKATHKPSAAKPKKTVSVKKKAE